ncbi:TNT domain-containing protein [Amycolatopsis sp. H20-H5]|nr:TNT domain-containing protein [Amycolatopsis sp. H20-H5]MEC3974643.1 TNT domain-containing protein [Amycolatopsis sp. H20-H5]
MEQPLSADDRQALLIRIGRLVKANVADQARQAEVDFRQVGDHTELRGRNTATPPELTELLAELRTGMYEPGLGTWLQSRFTLEPEGTFDFDFVADVEPAWAEPPGAGSTAYPDELAAFPRDDEHIPDWWRLRAQLPLGVVFRHARIVDSYVEGKPPEVDRPPLAKAEVTLVLQYLEREPSVLTGEGLGEDIFAAGPEADVPESYHTDGTWIWHASVPHYLRKYGIPPEPDLVAHIRAAQFQPPYVEHLMRRTAEAELLGRPRPKPGRADVKKTDGDLAAELETSPNPVLTDEEILVVLVRRLGEHDVWPEAYRVGERADGTWCLNFTADGWEVAAYAGGEPLSPRYFDRLEDAAQQLLGALLLHPARMTAGHDTPLETAKELGDWPVRAAPGEPPLTLLRNKRVSRLVAGTVVLRFGEETGNLVHHGGVRFATTSLPLERERDERTYRLRRPLHVITGITVPWANLPGGAVAHVLPKPIAEHVSDGSLERIE